MSNKYAAWILRVQVKDLEQLPFHPPAEMRRGRLAR